MNITKVDFNLTLKVHEIYQAIYFNSLQQFDLKLKKISERSCAEFKTYF